MFFIISWRSSLLYRDQSIHFHGGLIEWFSVMRALCLAAVIAFQNICFLSYHIITLFHYYNTIFIFILISLSLPTLFNKHIYLFAPFLEYLLLFWNDNVDEESE